MKYYTPAQLQKFSRNSDKLQRLDNKELETVKQLNSLLHYYSLVLLAVIHATSNADDVPQVAKVSKPELQTCIKKTIVQLTE